MSPRLDLIAHDVPGGGLASELLLHGAGEGRRTILARRRGVRVDRERLRSPGGTSGGLGSFLLGLVMAVAGGYLFIDRVTVFTSPWEIFGYSGYSLSLVPLIFGIFFLFFGRTWLGVALTAAGVVIIFAGIISHLRFFFQPTSLFATVVIFVLLFGGLGLIARAVFVITHD